MKPTLAIAKNESGNAKLGDAATTHAAQVSCPTSCVFRDGGGCYAETGRQGKFVTAPLNAAAGDASPLAVARAEAAAIDALDVMPGRPMRLHTVGDCATNEAALIVSRAAARYISRGGGPVWTYTHAWRDVDRASWGRVSVLASCETVADVAAAAAAGYAAALVVEDFKSEKLYKIGASEGSSSTDGPGGGSRHARRGSRVGGPDILPCPAQTRHATCSTCRLCFSDGRLRERGLTIGFALHGIPLAVRQARLALRTPDDPERRMPSEERIRILRARFLADHEREPTVKEVAEAIDLNPASVWEWLRFLRGETDHPAEVRRRRDARRAGAHR